jgi:glyoxylase-like metal-dependent hydrolase (beta-lactamase superfamily II)
VLHRDVAEGIHMIDDAFVNWFLVEGDDGLTVVDTALPSSWKSLQDAVAAIGRSVADIKAVVLTHGHFDHVGFARRAQQELGVPVWAHEKEVPVVRHPWRYDHERSRLPYFANPGFAKVFARMGLAGALWVRGVDDPLTYVEGQRLDVPGHPEVVFTPGHTHGHCSMHLRDRDTLIAGDAVVTLDPYTTKPGPRIVAGAATADSALALRSLDAIAATAARNVLTGHGPPWTEGAELAAERARAAGAA